MPASFEQAAGEAVRLSPKERIALAERGWTSVDTPEALEAAWDAEIARRLAQHYAGDVEVVPAGEVIAELHAKL